MNTSKTLRDAADILDELAKLLGPVKAAAAGITEAPDTEPAPRRRSGYKRAPSEPSGKKKHWTQDPEKVKQAIARRARTRKKNARG